jgi:hypothetical protein
MDLKKLLITAFGTLALGGCATPTPYLDQHFGLAVNTAKAQQTLNPEASRNPDPVTGMDGIAADNSVDEYHKSFKAPPPTFPVINIGVGGGGR